MHVMLKSEFYPADPLMKPGVRQPGPKTWSIKLIICVYLSVVFGSNNTNALSQHNKRKFSKASLSTYVTVSCPLVHVCDVHDFQKN